VRDGGVACYLLFEVVRELAADGVFCTEHVEHGLE
tara:strand:+ start:150 stop:254 length:105 start_codon:yes stop_codon:yes gene_type:complete